MKILSVFFASFASFALISFAPPAYSDQTLVCRRQPCTQQTAQGQAVRSFRGSAENVLIVDEVAGAAFLFFVEQKRDPITNVFRIYASTRPVPAQILSKVATLKSARDIVVAKNNGSTNIHLGDSISGINSVYDVVGNQRNIDAVSTHVSDTLSGVDYWVAYANSWGMVFGLNTVFTVKVLYKDGTSQLYKLSSKNEFELVFEQSPDSAYTVGGNLIPDSPAGYGDYRGLFDYESELSGWRTFGEGRGVDFRDNRTGRDGGDVSCRENGSRYECTLSNRDGDDR